LGLAAELNLSGLVGRISAFVDQQMTAWSSPQSSRVSAKFIVLVGQFQWLKLAHFPLASLVSMLSGLLS
jgi:hypothetical protein